MISFCPWCKRVRKFLKDNWETTSAEIPENAKSEICNDCYNREAQKIKGEGEECIAN